MGKRKLPQRVICLDVATNISGYAIGELPLDEELRRDNFRLIEYGTIRIPQQKDGKKVEADEKLEILFNRLHGVMKFNGNIIRAYVERPAMHNFVPPRGGGKPRQNIKTTIQVWRAYQCAMAAAWVEGIHAFDVSPATWRKTCGVKGADRKEKKENAVIMAKVLFPNTHDVHSEFVPTVITMDDEAEAICMLWHAISHCHLWSQS